MKLRKIYMCYICFILLVIVLFPIGLFSRLNNKNKINTSYSEKFYSLHLNSELLLMPGVFYPKEAETSMLPFMEDHQ
jgi:uncharacterized membrane protein SirB2